MLKSEKETVFRWDSEEKIVHIYSCHPRVWRLTERKGYVPLKIHVVNGQEIARRYRIPLACFRYGFRPLDRPRRPAPKGAFRPKKPAKHSRK